MNRKPYVKPVENFELWDRLDEIIGSRCAEDGKLAEIQLELREMLKEVMTLLPDIIKSRGIVTRRCFVRVERFVDQKGMEGFPDINDLRTVLCQEVTMVLFGEYIRTATHVLRDYLESHPEIKRWGIGSLCRFGKETDDTSNESFYAFWRNNVERGTDEMFYEKVVKEMPPEIRKKYAMQEVCPYIWSEMSDSDIAEVLIRLRKHHDPAKERWGVGSIREWKSPEKGNMWGKSFASYWASNVESGTAETFRSRMLPLLPQEWRANFYRRKRCPHDWGKMNGKQIASFLSGLSPAFDPARTRWGFGSIQRWLDSDGNEWGASLANWWRSNMDDDGYARFRDEVVVHLPEAWQGSYETKLYNPKMEWASMADEEIAEKIGEMLEKRTRKIARWAIGTLARCNADGVYVGSGFYKYWRGKVEPVGCDDQFRERIVRLLPSRLASAYKPQKYTIPFVDESGDVLERVDVTDDPNELYAILVDSNSEKAFKKLVLIIQGGIDKEAAYTDVIERSVHAYIPGELSIYAYCRKNVAMTRLYSRFKFVEFGRKADMETSPKDEYESLVESISANDFDADDIDALTAILTNEGRPLHEIVYDRNVPYAIRAIARVVISLIDETLLEPRL